MKKETPILFSTAMLQAILAGTKTMTRRAVKDLPTDTYFQSLVQHASGRFTWAPNNVYQPKAADIYERKPMASEQDKLWVREEHKIELVDGAWRCEYKDGTVVIKEIKGVSVATNKRLKRRKTLGKWQRARFLPKDFTRIWLEVTEIRVERLHDISEADAISEGIERSSVTSDVPLWRNYREPDGRTQFPIFSFSTLWEKINGNESLKANPWVWVIGFKVLSTTGKPVESEVAHATL